MLVPVTSDTQRGKRTKGKKWDGKKWERRRGEKADKGVGGERWR